MGVLGLNPFLRKTCPDVFKTLPNRFSALTGKTIVFDGTLITQRLHFAPMPYSHRHVIGWYRIIQELRESSVSAICVFDGRFRNAAKQMEVNRRREARKTLAIRGTHEQHRYTRLQKLTALVQEMRPLDRTTQGSVLESVRTHELYTKDSFPPTLPTYTAGTLNLPDEVNPPILPFPRHSLEQEAHIDAYGEFEQEDILELLLKDTKVSSDVAPEPCSEAPLTEDLEDHDFVLEDRPAAEHMTVVNTIVDQASGFDRVNEVYELMDLSHADSPTFVQPQAISLPVDKLMASLTELYVDYRRSTDDAEYFRQQNVATSLTNASAEEHTDSRMENMISKAQQQLTNDEGKFWEQLLHSGVPSSEQATASVASLKEKSGVLSESYRRRTNAPTATTYEECKEILCAMGVPCIETTGPYEAEALASSMVLHGQADYVASEDTDVLVYGAPLVRNISSSSDPLVIVSGTEVRETLQLDQERFVDFALLLGTDFTRRIKSVGPSRALHLIRKHGTIEEILQHEKQYSPRSPALTYLQEIATARRIFQTLPPVPGQKPTQKPADAYAMQSIIEKHGLWRHLCHEPASDALAGNYFNDSPFVS